MNFGWRFRRAARRLADPSRQAVGGVKRVVAGERRAGVSQVLGAIDEFVAIGRVWIRDERDELVSDSEVEDFTVHAPTVVLAQALGSGPHFLIGCPGVETSALPLSIWDWRHHLATARFGEVLIAPRSGCVAAADLGWSSVLSPGGIWATLEVARAAELALTRGLELEVWVDESTLPWATAFVERFPPTGVARESRGECQCGLIDR